MAATSRGPLDGTPAFAVARPVMTQRWLRLSSVHWRIDPREIETKLPESLSADTFDGSGWVGLIPFEMVGIAPGTWPAIPYFGTFPETNIRTYVIGPSGPGIWFHSLDISRLAPVIVARATYRLPYMWSRMKIEQSADRVKYVAHRRWPKDENVTSNVRLDIGDRIKEPSQLEHFLSARWGLYTMLGKRLAFAKVEHAPWPLHHASIEELEDDFLAAAGYSPVDGPAHAMYSPGVSVRIERPRFVD